MKKLQLKLKIISVLGLFFLAVFPSEIFAHTGSKRACYDSPDSQKFRKSRTFPREGDPIPVWTPGKKTGGGSHKRPEKCMHYGYERHKGPKGKKLTDICHKHFINDRNKKIFAAYDREGNRLGKNHTWGNVHDLVKCRKTG